MAANAKPPGARVLVQRGIPHEIVAFDPAIRDAGEVARAAGEETSAVFKTLVVVEEPARGKPLLVLVPADQELDLKPLAGVVGAKRLRMASYAEAERLTGLKVGGISALALLGRGFRVYIDRTATELAEVLVSAGQRGFDIRLDPASLVRLTGAIVVEGCTRPVGET
jgi:Cys-tRNA(Pro)/Cys-tRNA(Cys) deacylase